MKTMRDFSHKPKGLTVSSARQINTQQITGPEGSVPEIRLYHPPLEGDYLLRDSVPISELYRPVTGSLLMNSSEPYKYGLKFTGTYRTPLAQQEVSIYRPDNLLSPASMPKPTVVMTGALFTGIDGHNDVTAREIAEDCNVILKGVPRYSSPGNALSLTEDVNEMHGILDVLKRDDYLKLGSLEQVYGYGESQSAMKQLGFVALASSYDRKVVNGMAVAPCFIGPANFHNPVKALGYATSLAKSTLAAGRNMSLTELWERRKTVDLRDMHHHFGVMPVLVSGEAGLFLPHIDRRQLLDVELFGKDYSSRAHRTKQTLDRNFSNINTTLYENYGHVDGIMSAEVKTKRQQIFKQAAFLLANS